MPQTHSTAEQLSVPVQSTEDEDPEELMGAVGGAAAVNEQDISSIEWMLSAGVEDPDLMGKIRYRLKCYGNPVAYMLVLISHCMFPLNFKLPPLTSKPEQNL